MFIDHMFDSKGNLRAGYTNERSYDYKLVDLSTQRVAAHHLLTPNEAADLNASARCTNLRWVPLN